jgi:hypothetical protein
LCLYSLCVLHIFTWSLINYVSDLLKSLLLGSLNLQNLLSHVHNYIVTKNVLHFRLMEMPYSWHMHYYKGNKPFPVYQLVFLKVNRFFYDDPSLWINTITIVLCGIHSMRSLNVSMKSQSCFWLADPPGAILFILNNLGGYCDVTNIFIRQRRIQVIPRNFVVKIKLWGKCTV